MEYFESFAVSSALTPLSTAIGTPTVNVNSPIQLLLASASPRRQELLRQIGLTFDVVRPDVTERRLVSESPRDYVQRVACDKAQAGKRLAAALRAEGLPILAADTEVVLDAEVLGKPADRAAGVAQLKRLAGRTHEVMTALCLLHAGAQHTAVSISRVTFGPLSDAQIQRYWDSGEPVDKAGGYGIQGRAAGFIAHLDGSYSGVMGLPLYELTQILREIGINGQ
jgi:septum formation protein